MRFFEKLVVANFSGATLYSLHKQSQMIGWATASAALLAQYVPALLSAEVENEYG